MRCQWCNQEIADKAWRLHQVVCPNKPSVAQTGVQAADTAAVAPVAGATVVTKPGQMPEFKAMEPATGDAGALDSVVTSTHPESASRPAPAAPPEVGTPEYRQWWGGLTKEEQEAELIRRGLPPKDIGQPQIVSQNGSEIFYPVVDPYFMVSEFIVDALEITERMSRKNPTNLLITGQPGGGKTSLALQFAAKYQRPAVVADFGVLQEPQQLFQTTHLVQKDGGVVTETRESAFIRGIETKRCVVVMDEMTRVENERCLNPLMPILDGRKSTWIDELHRRIHVAEEVVFIATINEGSMFAGITSLDAALRDRFREVFIDYLPATEESKVIQAKCNVDKLIANSLAEFAYAVRHTPSISRKISTRQLLHAAEAYSCGATLWQAIETAIGNYNDLAWRQQVMEIFSLNIKDTDEYRKWTSKPRTDSYVQYK